MKKIMFVFGAFALAFAATAELDTLITFSTKGPDTYCDGNTVMDGECYALVWTKNGAKFAGINADGTCVDPVNNELVLSAPIAKDGKCPPVMYVVKADNAARYADGSYSIYLLDTRKATGEVDADGKPVYTIPALNGGKPAAINSYVAVKDNMSAQDGELASSSASASVLVTTPSKMPPDAPKAEIIDIQVVGDNVHLTVTNTVPYLLYNVAAGETPAAQSGAVAQTPKNGEADNVITLIVPKKGDQGFFKVQRNVQSN